MGTVDRVTYTLSCKTCGTKQSASISQRGSSFSRSWGCAPAFTLFATEWEGGGDTEPELLSAKCRKCGKLPDIDSNYGA